MSNNPLHTINISKEGADRIKNAIRDKLIEIGVYVDDELTDYIIVMLANKKSERQMIADLDLFLSSKAAKFTSWLFEYVNRIKESDKINKHSAFKSYNQYSQEDELAIQIDSNEFNDEDNIGLTSNQQFNNKQNENNESKLRQQLINRSNNKNNNNGEKTRHRGFVSSQVGAIIHHNDDYGDYDEEKSSNNLSSIIKVPERKFSVPKELQPNKSILLKAIDDANNSVTHQNLHPKTPKNSIKSRLSRPNSATSNGNGNTAVAASNRDLDDSFNRIKLRIERDATIAKPEFESSDNENENAFNIHNTKTDDTNNTKFIVTLKGVNEKEFLNKMETDEDENRLNKSLKRSLSDEDDDEDEYDDGVDVEYDENEDDENLNEAKRFKIRCAYWPSCEKADSCPYVHPNKPCEAFPKCSFGNKCHYIHPLCKYNGFCARPDCIYAHSKSTAAATSIVKPLKPKIKILKQKYSINNTNKKVKNTLPPRSALKWTSTINQQQPTAITTTPTNDTQITYSLETQMSFQ